MVLTEDDENLDSRSPNDGESESEIRFRLAHPQRSGKISEVSVSENPVFRRNFANEGRYHFSGFRFRIYAKFLTFSLFPEFLMSLLQKLQMSAVFRQFPVSGLPEPEKPEPELPDFIFGKFSIFSTWGKLVVDFFFDPMCLILLSTSEASAWQEACVLKG